MNIALPAVTLLLLLLPGILAVQTFLGRIGRRAREPVGQTGITWPWLVALLLAPIIHLITWGAIVCVGFPPPDLQAVLILLSGHFDDTTKFEQVLTGISEHRWHISSYFVGASIAGLFFGWIAQWAIRKCKLDRRVSFLRFASDWHYLLAGELYPDTTVPDFVVVAATVEHGSTCYLYLGVLRTYAFDRDGELQRLHLSKALRRPISADRAPDQAQQNPDTSNRFYAITGDELVIVCRDVRTLNVRYMYASAQEAASAPASSAAAETLMQETQHAPAPSEPAPS